MFIMLHQNSESVSFNQKTGHFKQCKEPACSGVLSLDVLKAPISLGHYRHVQQVL